MHLSYWLKTWFIFATPKKIGGGVSPLGPYILDRQMHFIVANKRKTKQMTAANSFSECSGKVTCSLFHNCAVLSFYCTVAWSFFAVRFWGFSVLPCADSSRAVFSLCFFRRFAVLTNAASFRAVSSSYCFVACCCVMVPTKWRVLQFDSYSLEKVWDFNRLQWKRNTVRLNQL